jgi:site-specific DNA recombinase
MDMEKLQFAPLIRVSTEKQEKRGESLSTQRKQLERAIQDLGGTVYKWYAGQEHATPDHERKILDELMADSQAGNFNAIMVADISRWSRDNQKSKKYLSILKENKIQFYWLGRHMDLTVPFNNLMIGMGTEINEFFASEQAYKSITNRIERAKKGIPVAGKLPYGRTYDKKTGKWGIDSEKQFDIQHAAKKYLSGESMDSIAALYGMNTSNLHKILKHRCGNEWKQKFKSKQLKIDEPVTIEIPRLLDESIIKQIHERSEANRTYTHGLNKYNYLLARTIFCEKCGYALFGQANKKGILYYRHPRNRGCKNTFFNSIPAVQIEKAVIYDIFMMIGNRPAIEAATKAAIPNLKEIEQLEVTNVHAEKQIQSFKLKKERLFDEIEKNTISSEDVKERMTIYNDQIEKLQSEIDRNKKKCETLPTAESISMRMQLMLRLKQNILRSYKHLSEMTFDEKRKLLQMVFAGQDVDGKRYGIYVNKTKTGEWMYTIKGIFQDFKGNFKNIDSIEFVDAKYSDDNDDNQLDYLDINDKQNMSGQCNAYNSFRFHQ